MKRARRYFLLLLFLTIKSFMVQAQESSFWNLIPDGSIIWNVKKGMAHNDHIEMSGMKMSAVITYGTDEANNLILSKRIFFPMLRTIPNDTRGSLSYTFDESTLPVMNVDGARLKEQPIAFRHNGLMQVITHSAQGIKLVRTISPSVDKPALVEIYTISNTSKKAVTIEVPSLDSSVITNPVKGVYGAYIINRKTEYAPTGILRAGETVQFSVIYSARKERDPEFYVSANYELDKRKAFLKEINESLVLKTPDDPLNALFNFAKIRTTESVFDTKGGLMHGPGGSNYYAALWANDQGEFTSPFFPFLGNAAGNESALNCYRSFAAYINPEYKRIPSSIIAEGDDTWNWGETKYGDRGDAAMLLYGASRFALALADTIKAKRLWPLISWCATYTLRRKNDRGVIVSETDGEEGRFPTGNANLYVNALTYGGLVTTARLASVLGYEKEKLQYLKEAQLLRNNLDKFFSAKILGYNIYKYYEEAQALSGWMGLPLAMGLTDKANEIQKALFSSYMWRNDIILSVSDNTTKYFERPMLNSFRGLFFCGWQIDTTLKYFRAYSRLRLLGPHVPYIVEAYPEGNGRQLAGDNALYCRIITEGLFGIEPVSFNQFTIAPRLPQSWNEMSLNHIRAFNGDFNILAKREKGKLRVTVTNHGSLVKQLLWNGDEPISIVL